MKTINPPPAEETWREVEEKPYTKHTMIKVLGSSNQEKP